MASFGSDVMRRSIELAIQATGTQALDDVAAKIKYNSDVIQVLSEQYKQNVISGEQYRASVAGLIAENDKLEASLKAVAASQLQLTVSARQFSNAQQGVVREVQFYTDILEEAYEAELKLSAAQVQSTATKQKLQEEADKTNRVMRNFSYTILATGHAFQDAAQGGFGAILNNIPLLTQGFTSLAADMGNFTDETRNKLMAWAPAVAGTFTIVATASYVLYQNWDKVERLFQGGIPRPILDTTAELERKLKAAKDRTEELGKLTTMTVSEVNEYRKATEAVKTLNEQLERQKELKELLDGQSKDQRERGSAFKEALAQSGNRSALDELRQALNRQEDAQGRVFNPVANAMTSAQTAAEDMIRDAAKGDKGTIDAIGKALRDAFGDRSGFARNIQAASPEGQAMAKMGQQHGEILDQMNEEIVKAEEQAAEKRKNALISYWVGDEQKVATNLERSIEQAKGKAERDAEKQKREDARALDMTLKAAGQQDIASEKDAAAAAKLFGKDYLANIQREFLENKRRQLAGNGVVGNLQDFQFGNQMGQQPALDDAVLQRWMASRVAVDLRRAGKDAGLAPRVVRDASEAVDQRWGQAMAKFGNQQDALISLMQDSQLQIAKIQQEMGRRDAQIMQMQGQAGRMRNQKRTLLPHPAQR